jgi:hypothetical protein
VSVTRIFVASAVHRTLTIHVGLAISIVVLLHDRGVDPGRADLDAGIGVLLGWTLLRHFRLASPVQRLPRGMPVSPSARSLVTGIVLPLRFDA